MKQSSVVRSSQRKKSRANGFGFVSSAQFELDQTEARERRRAQVEADVTRIAESEEQVEHDRARRHAAKKAAKQRAAARRHEQKHVRDVGCDSMLNSGPDQVISVGPESMRQSSDGCSVAMKQCPPAPQSCTEIPTRTNGPSIEHLCGQQGGRSCPTTLTHCTPRAQWPARHCELIRPRQWTDFCGLVDASALNSSSSGAPSDRMLVSLPSTPAGAARRQSCRTRGCRPVHVRVV